MSVLPHILGWRKEDQDREILGDRVKAMVDICRDKDQRTGFNGRVFVSNPYVRTSLRNM